ncbi:MAG: class I SAM-dependent methyltransferase, partial [Solirubrobacteraceae bacterium]
MSQAITRDAEGTVTGNTYDKYGSTNPVVKRLMAGFERTLDELFVRAAPSSLLDVGCGEGVLTHQWARRLGDERRVVGIDLDDPALHAEWAKRTAPRTRRRLGQQTGQRGRDRGRIARPDRRAEAAGGQVVAEDVAAGRHGRQAGPDAVEQAGAEGEASLDPVEVERDRQVGVEQEGSALGVRRPI